MNAIRFCFSDAKAKTCMAPASMPALLVRLPAHKVPACLPACLPACCLLPMYLLTCMFACLPACLLPMFLLTPPT